MIPAASSNEPIAIIGMACRLPGAADPDELWQMVVDGRESVKEYPGGRTPELDAFYRRVGMPDGPASSRGGFLEGIDRFDAEFFEISPREAEWLDPQQRLLLETAWEALEDAGVSLERVAKEKTGVFAGVWNNEYERHATANSSVAEFFLVTGGPLYGASSRIAYQFDLRGPDVSVNAACGSSLVAVHLAVRALRSGECAMALAGGVNAMVRHEFNQALSRSKMLSPDGRCKFGDASANGFVRSDGVGLLVLKRLGEAQLHGDNILALIRGTSICNDGRGSGLLATPSAAGQRQAMLEALADAGVAAETVDLVEAHGTGTRAGDPIEIAAIASVFGRTGEGIRPCRIASVKSNIGHAESAAGVASIIRTVQAMRYRRFPATLHVDTPNPAIDWGTIGLRLETEGAEWIAQDGAPLRAGVNGLGLTGTNAHVILESAPAGKVHERVSPPAFLLVLSAASAAALKARAASFAAALGALPEQDAASDALYDLCSMAASRRTHLPHRLAVTGSNPAGLRLELDRWLEKPATSVAAAGVVGEERRRIVFLFPGQGSQWIGMCRELLAANTAFRLKMEEVDAAIAREAGWSVVSQLVEPVLEDRLSQIDVVQPTLFAVEVALAALWQAWGVAADAVAGHSMGEVAAAHVSGVLSLDDAVKIICRRSRLLLRVTGSGAMVVIDLPRADAERRIAGLGDKVSVAVCNSPRSTVLAGDPATLNDVVEELERNDVFCRWVRVDVASHSPQMDPLRDDLAFALAGIEPKAGMVPMQSTVSLDVTAGEQMGPAYWVANLRQTVMFGQAIGKLTEQGNDTFLEMSPHPLLLPFIEQAGGQAATSSSASLIALGSLKRDEPELATLLGTLGRLFVAGAAIDWSAVYPAGNLVRLPAYPWQRQRFWMVSAATGRGSSFTGGHPLAGEAQRTGGDDRIWTAAISGELHPWLKDHVVGEAALLPASAYLEMAAAVCGSIFGEAVATIEELALTRAAVVPEAGAMQFQVIAAKETQDAYALTFYCRDSAAAEWDRVASAQIRKQAATSRALKADLREWQDAEFSDQATGGTQHSRRMAELGYSFGPAFCNLAWLSLDEERALARISNANLRSESYLIHPALLDAALQLLGRLLLEQSEDPKTLLPVSCARAEWFAAAVAGEALYARAVAALNELSGEVEVFGEDGRLLVRLSGFTFAPLARQAGESLDELIFELAWEPLDLSAVNGRRGQDASIAQWLVVSEDLDHGRRLAEALRGFDVHVDVLGPGEVLSIVSGGTASREIVWFVSAQSQRSRRSALDDVLNQMSQLAEAIAALDRGEEGLSQTRLCVVTRGTQAVADEGVTSVFEAGLWGFVASAQNEYPQLKTLCIDLPETALKSEPDAVAEILLRGGDEKKIALRVQGAFVPRLVPGVTAACEGGLIPASELRSFPTGVTEGFDLVQTVPGTINSFGLFTSWTEPPCEGEVQIQVRAAGLNFRDVLRVMGLNEAISASQIGGECAGVVLRTGTGVRNFAPGDEVLAMSPSFYAKGMFASCVNVPEVLVAKKPATMSFAEAAGIPCVFVTAWYSLVNLARLQPGERVLIHAAAGGVGLAAIQVAKWIGSEIFATVGSEEKREYLRGLGVTRIMNSRTLDFTREILEATGGQGVDVVLNSLAGPAIAAGLEALAPYGRFVEIGKRDIWENGRIGLKPFQKNLSLYAVDLSQTVEDRRSLVGSMLTKIMEHMASGDLKPVKTETFPVSAAGDAFQLMANAGHIGKIALDLRNPSAMIHRDRSKLDPSATYLITGGTGGLGLTTAKTFVRHGARHLVLSARTAPGESVRGAIREMEKAGAQVYWRQADASVQTDVAALLEEIRSTMPRLAGIVHAAGVLDDAVVADLTLANFVSVSGGKVGGAMAIDGCLNDFDLDFIVYYASAAGVLGNPAQANYAAANTMLDALAHRQRVRGIPAMSIDWGSWSGVGLAAASEERGTRMATRGLRPVTPETGAALLMHLLKSDAVQVAAMQFDPTRWCASHASAGRSHLFDRLLQRSDVLSASNESLAQMLLRVESGERRVKLVRWLREQVATVLRLEPDRVPEDKPLRTLGLDSLMALELRNRLERTLPVKLSATFAWNYPTLLAIAGYLESRLEAGRPEASRVMEAHDPVVATASRPDTGELDTGGRMGSPAPAKRMPVQSAADLLEAELAGTALFTGQGR